MDIKNERRVDEIRDVDLFDVDLFDDNVLFDDQGATNVADRRYPHGAPARAAYGIDRAPGEENDDDNRGRVDETAAQTDYLHQAAPLDPELILHLKDLVGFDEPAFLLELLDTYLEDAERTIATLPQAWRVQDLFGVMRAAHSLKSASATLTAVKLEQLTSRLENEMRGQDSGLDVAAHIELIVAEYQRVHTALLDERAKLAELLA